MRRTPNTTTTIEYASVYQNDGCAALIASVPISVAGSAACGAIAPPSAASQRRQVGREPVVAVPQVREDAAGLPVVEPRRRTRGTRPARPSVRASMLARDRGCPSGGRTSSGASRPIIANTTSFGERRSAIAAAQHDLAVAHLVQLGLEAHGERAPRCGASDRLGRRRHELRSRLLDRDVGGGVAPQRSASRRSRAWAARSPHPRWTSVTSRAGHRRARSRSRPRCRRRRRRARSRREVRRDRGAGGRPSASVLAGHAEPSIVAAAADRDQHARARVSGRAAGEDRRAAPCVRALDALGARRRDGDSRALDLLPQLVDQRLLHGRAVTWSAPAGFISRGIGVDRLRVREVGSSVNERLRRLDDLEAQAEPPRLERRRHARDSGADDDEVRDVTGVARAAERRGRPRSRRDDCARRCRART